MMIDLRSDTVTRPTKAMLEAMFEAKVGDDVLGDDPTIHELQEFAADMFGMEAALFCPSGTMTNQIAINVHTRPGDEVICHKLSHIYYYEGGGIMRNSGVSVCLLDGDRGLITADNVQKHINPDDIHRPVTTLVEVENTMNKGGGAFYDYNTLVEINQVCKRNNLKFHLDGARLFNALIETKQTPKDYGKIFDSISICLSKGLGAPIGSLLLGSNDFIKRSLRTRKSLGGAMRQAGYLAAAGIYALNNHIHRLKEDHQKAKYLADILLKTEYVESVLPVDTNILIFNLTNKLSEVEFINILNKHNIQALSLAPQQIRFVTHLDFTEDMLLETEKVLKSIQPNF